MAERKKSRAINGDDILDPIDAVKQIIKLYNASDNVAIAYLNDGPFSHITLTDNTTITYRWMESIKMLNYACAQKFLDIKTMNGMELTINIDQIRYIIDRG